MPERTTLVWAVAISGDTLVVGAYPWSCSTSVSTTAATDNGCYNAGAAYVYVRSGASWSFQTFLKAPNAGIGDWFGGRWRSPGYDHCRRVWRGHLLDEREHDRGDGQWLRWRRRGVRVCALGGGVER